MKRLIALLIVIIFAFSCGTKEYSEVGVIPTRYLGTKTVTWHDGVKEVVISDVKELHFNQGYVRIISESGKTYVIYSGMLVIE